jgi:uncharacterized protein YkwD
VGRRPARDAADPGKGKEADLKELDAAYKRAAEAFPAMAAAAEPAGAALARLRAEVEWLDETERHWARADPTHDKGKWDLAAVLQRTGRTAPDDDALSAAESVSRLLAGAKRAAAANAKAKFPKPDEAAVLAETNARRLNLGLVPLVIVETLTEAARVHSADMQRLKFFAHESPVKGKTTPADRAKLAGYSGGVGENISFNYPSAAAAVLGWWHSAGHRLNMLGNWDEIGLGTQGPYRTMLLGSPGPVEPSLPRPGEDDSGPAPQLVPKAPAPRRQRPRGADLQKRMREVAEAHRRKACVFAFRPADADDPPARGRCSGVPWLPPGFRPPRGRGGRTASGANCPWTRPGPRACCPVCRTRPC